MKHITKLSILAAVVAGFGTSAALADDPQLQNRLALQRAQAQGSERTTTVAVYAVKGLTLGRADRTQERSESRFELRTNAHGQTFGTYAPIK
jgi:hypothetical protein